MSPKNRGKYASKHPDGTELEPNIAEQIQSKQESGRLACAVAVKIADECKTSLAEVGRNADLIEIRIDRCILGLFGFELVDGKKRRVKPAESVSAEVESAIRSQLEDGRLTCRAAWDLAAELQVARPSIAEACEALEIRMSNCQLGAF